MPKKPVTDWRKLEQQFMMSHFDSWSEFVEFAGLAKSLRYHPTAAGIAKRKQAIMARLRESLTKEEVTNRIRYLEKVRKDSIESAVQAGQHLMGAVTLRLALDNQMTQKKAGESDESWVKRVAEAMQKKTIHSASYLAFCGAAMERAQMVLWRAAAMDGYQYDKALADEAAKARGLSMKFEIVKTSEAPDLEDLEHAKDVKEIEGGK